MKLHHKARALILCTALCAAPLGLPASAQEDKGSKEQGNERSSKSDAPTKEQVQQLQEVMLRIDADVIKAFEARPDVRKEIEGAIASIAEQKSLKTKSDMILDYQKKYGDVYRETLEKGGVRLEDYASQLQSILALDSHERLVVVNGTHFETMQEEPERGASSDGGASSGEYASTSQALGESRELAADEYISERSLDCGVAAGGKALIGSDSIESVSTAIVAGGCSAETSKVARVGGAGSLEARADLRVHGVAIGIVGTAACRAETNLWERRVLGGKLYKAIIAPIFWVAQADQSKAVSVLSSGPDAEVSLRASTTAAGILGGVDCHAGGTNLRTTFTP